MSIITAKQMAADFLEWFRSGRPAAQWGGIIVNRAAKPLFEAHP